MKVDGGCLCGHITYEAEVNPDKVTLCHCTDCQTMSGSAFRLGLAVPDTDFTILSGAPKTFVKTAESGNKRAQMFCPQCGTHIYATSIGEGPKILRLRIATARQRGDLTPKAQGWVRSAQPWLDALDTIPKSDRQPSIAR